MDASFSATHAHTNKIALDSITQDSADKINNAASKPYVDDKITKMMCWTNFMNYIGEKDPSTVTGETLYNAVRWHQTAAGTSTVWDIYYWDEASASWKYIDHWTTMPEDVASFRNTDSTNDANKYAFLVFENWTYGSTLNPLG